MLKDNYFTILDRQHEGNDYKYGIRLNKDHEIYQGHFPGNPISPGVCSIQTIRECCEEALDCPLRIDTIDQCRFLSLLTPDKGECLQVAFSLDAVGEQVKAVATINDGSTVYVTLKATFGKKQTT